MSVSELKTKDADTLRTMMEIREEAANSTDQMRQMVRMWRR